MFHLERQGRSQVSQCRWVVFCCFPIALMSMQTLTVSVVMDLCMDSTMSWVGCTIWWAVLDWVRKIDCRPTQKYTLHVGLQFCIQYNVFAFTTLCIAENSRPTDCYPQLSKRNIKESWPALPNTTIVSLYLSRVHRSENCQRRTSSVCRP